MGALSTGNRAIHLLTNAAWFGGSLMGAVGLNPAAQEADGRDDATRVMSTGWERWGPVQGGAIGLHLLSGVGLLLDNRRRTRRHAPTRRAVVAKTVLTGAALAAAAASYDEGRKLGEARASKDTVRGHELSSRLGWLQWAVPTTTGALLVLDAYLGEQQRGVAGLLDRGR